MGVAVELRTVWALMRRALNEIVRVPGAAIPGVLAPTIFMLGLTAVFGKLTLLPGFTTTDFMSFLIPVSVIQGAGFTGAATGVNLARDIELGWFDRLVAAPPARWALLAGLVLSASLRAPGRSGRVWRSRRVLPCARPGLRSPTSLKARSTPPVASGC